ncbi:Trichothecene C-15 hydroxylase [Cladobotryum mycophilum]|uniref:Trichothecene C-15 hydroxylase n=1 Tax=Cladobotryum mycophilum TaxID=491253 RepID=A0ABR0SJQ7_9HYPO
MGVLSHQLESFDSPVPKLPVAVLAPSLILLLTLSYTIYRGVYNVFFHPLRHYPGPKLWAMTGIPYGATFLSGQGHRKILDLHLKYGPAVRIAPDTLSYSHPDAVKEIRGHRKHGQAEHGKDPNRSWANRDNVIGADRFNHTRYRRSLANGFSHQAMIDQQPIIKGYVDKLIDRLKEVSAGGTQKLDIVRWFNYATFDIIGDLSFGEPFGCLEKSDYHPWVSLVFNSVKNIAFQSVIKKYHNYSWILNRLLMPKDLAPKYAEHRQLSAAKLHKRLSADTDRPDFVASMSTKRGSLDELTPEEMSSHASLLIIAGSETTATALSAAAYYLALNPRVMAKLNEEVRTTFSTEEEIDLLSVQGLTYMHAVLDEAMRLFPAVPGGQPRMAAKGGDTIIGQFVPEGTLMEVWQWVAHHNPEYFTLPEEFIPERWLGDPRFANDQTDVFQPFSYGPRNCIGKNLAYAEMRLMLARLVWNFDLKMTEESRGWAERSQIYLLWEKGAIDVYLTPRNME